MNLSLSSNPAGTQTPCPYCGVGCGVRAMPAADGSVAVAGDETHPANRGKLCVKGAALGEIIDLEGRLLHPQINGRQATWDQALDAVAGGLRGIIERDGPDAVALYVSGQLLTEDYYVANKLMKGYIGSANIDTNSRLCMSSAVAGHKRAFGADLVPLCYDDLEKADMVVLVGSNTAWCHPILFQRLMQAKLERPQMKLVVVDPRRTATCEQADMHLPVKSGTDVWLFNGLLSYLERNGAADREFIADHTSGIDAALAAAEVDCADPAAVAAVCGIALPDLLAFYEQFSATVKVITAFSQGVNQSSAGTDKVNSIINCHLLTGRIGRPGMGPFSITGQPNAMGGREVGGLANMLAAHMDLDRPEHREIVQTFWDSPRIADRPGLKAVDLFQAIEAGRVKAVWIISTNPVVSLPEADQVKRALEKCELVICQDIVEHTDTNAFADILLPAQGWGEKDGTVTNSERRISRQRRFLAAPGQTRPDWQIICQVAQRMGYAGFDFNEAHEVFDEHARLSTYRNDENGAGTDAANSARRIFNLDGLTGMNREQFDGLQPIQWPVSRRPSGSAAGTARLFADRRYAHADGKARFVATPPRSPRHAADAEFPLILNTGRMRDQWHTMTRTGKSVRLAEHTPEPFIDLHAQDALLYGVQAGQLARIVTRWGAMVARVQTSGGVARGSLFAPIHWNDQTASDARVGGLVNPVVDPISGEPEFKHTPVRIEPFHVSWHGFVLSRNAIDADRLTYWTRIRGKQFLRYEFSGRETVAAHGDWARALLGITDPDADWLEYEDRSAGVYRAVHVVDQRIDKCIFLSSSAALPPRNWLAGLFDQAQLDDLDRTGLLLGQPAKPAVDTGRTICSCYGVGSNTICDAIRERNLDSVAQVTACLKAGGNCGSCVPEIKKLLTETRLAVQAA